MRNFVFSILVLFSFSSIYGQKIELEKLLEIDLDTLDEETFIKEWVDKYKLQYNKQNKSCYVYKAPDLLEKPISSLSFKLNNGKHLKIECKIDKFPDIDNYPQWAKQNTQILTLLNKRLGKPTDFSVSKELRVTVLWQLKKFFVKFIGSACNNLSSSSNECSIHLFTKEAKINDISQPANLPQVYFDFFRSNIEGKLKNYRPISKAAAQNIAARIKSLTTFKLDPAKTQKFYWQEDENSYPIISPDRMSFDVATLFLKTSSEPLKDGHYIGCFFENGLLKKSNKIVVENGKSKEVSKIYYWYEKNRAIKVIKCYYPHFPESYWFDYDDKGQISRVIKFRDNTFQEYCSFYSTDKYNEFANITFTPDGDILNLQYVGDLFSVYMRKYKPNVKSYDFISVDSELHRSAQLFKKMKLLPILPNILPNDNFETTKPYNEQVGLLVFNEFKKFTQFKKDYLTQVQKLMESQKQNPEKIFQSKESSLCEIIKITKNYFPIVLRQVGKGAVKVLTQDKKIYVIKEKQIFLDTYQLSQITKAGCEFKNIKTGEIHSLLLNKALTLGDAAFVKQAGRIHKISDNDNFFGYDVKIKGKTINFNSELINFQPTHSWFSLTPLENGTSQHTLSHCKCYNDIQFDQKMKEPDLDEIKLAGNDIQFAKSAQIDLQYLLKNCTFMILKNTLQEFRDGNMTSEYDMLGSYTLKDNKIVPFEENKNNAKVTYSNGQFKVDLKSFQHHKDDIQSGYYIKLNSNNYYVLSFMPKNPWTLERLIDQYSIQINDATKGAMYFSFSRKVCSKYVNKKFVHEPFEYSIDPDKYQIKIDDIIYEIKFKKDKVFFISKSNNSISKLQVNHFSPIILKMR